MMPRNPAGGNAYEPPDDRRRIRGQARAPQFLCRADARPRAALARRGRLSAIRRSVAAERSEPRLAGRGVARPGRTRRACKTAADGAEPGNLPAVARQPQGDALHRRLVLRAFAFAYL